MRLERRSGRRGLLYSWLLIGSAVAPACRFGYQELDDLAGSGASSSQGASSTTAGSGAANTGGTNPNTGGTNPNTGGTNPNTGGTTQTLGGDGPASGAGQPSAQGGSGSVEAAGQPGLLGGAPPLGDGGAASQAGATGAAGSPANPPGCTTTADCSCASLQGHIYWFCTPLLNQAAAEARCESQAMHLVRVDSQAETDFLSTTGAQQGVFANDGFAQIGASDQLTPGTWAWTDGTPFWQGGSGGTTLGGLYANWANQSPGSSGSKDCAGIISVGTWQNRSCTALDSFICEAP